MVPTSYMYDARLHLVGMHKKICYKLYLLVCITITSRSLRIVTWWWKRLQTRSIPTRFAKWTEQQMLLWWIWRALAASAEQDLHFALGTLGA